MENNLEELKKKLQEVENLKMDKDLKEWLKGVRAKVIQMENKEFIQRCDDIINDYMVELSISRYDINYINMLCISDNRKMLQTLINKIEKKKANKFDNCVQERPVIGARHASTYKNMIVFFLCLLVAAAIFVFVFRPFELKF